MKPSPGISRRKFIGSAIVTAGAAAVASRVLGAEGEAKGAPQNATLRTRGSSMKLGLDAGVDDAVTLGFMRQVGAEWLCASLLPSQGEALDRKELEGVVTTGFDGAGGGIGGPPGGKNGPWTEAEFAGLQAKVHAAGIKLGAVYLHAFPNAVLGRPGRDRDIANVCQSIELAGRLGVKVLLYNFFGLRNVEGLYAKPGRGGASYRAFDEARVKDQSPVAAFGRISEEQIWKNQQYFLQAVIPVAEKAGVRLALHPNDPPTQAYRGISQPFASIDQWKRMVNFLPSPSNGLVLDTGVIAQLDGDVLGAIRYFGERNCLNHVHFRNARCEKAGVSYYETFIDEGTADMPAAFQALKDVGFSGMIVPDHSPAIAGDTTRLGGWGYALGYIRALMMS